jgi:poly(beta-D-mannuronate) lyase
VTVPVEFGERRLVPRATDKAGNQAWNSINISVAALAAAPAPVPPGENIPTPLRTVSVTSISGLASAISQAKPGDKISLKNGVYSASSSIQISAKGTATNPILITSDTIGGAEIGGAHGFSLNNAQYVIIRGFKLTYSQDNSDPATRCSNCIHVRFTQNTFALRSSAGDESDWLGISGTSSHVRVDNNLFQNKNTQGTFLTIVGDNGKMPQNTRVDHNTFRNHNYDGSNGGECVLIGHSSLGPVAANSILEYNTFERCDGDPEVISVKSSKNTFRYNTFRDNEGSLVFRHGSGHIAEGNIFLGGTSGIRVYGANHKIINNYFANNQMSGSSIYNPIIIPRATTLNDLSTSNAEYSQPRNILVAHNTLVGNSRNIVIGAFAGSYLPQSITIANNIVMGSSGEMVDVQSGQVSFKKNILYPTGSAKVGDAPATGYINANPLLTNVAGLMRPSSSSPAINAVAASEAFGVTKDIDGQLRSGLRDIGADEKP